MNDAVLLELIDLCYAAVDDRTCWQTFINKLAQALKADAGDLAVEHYERGIAAPLGTVGFDPQYRESYDLEFLGENPWITQAHKLPLCRAFTSQFEPSDFERSDYYNLWLKPQGFRHGVGAILDKRPDRVIHLGFIRTHAHGTFSDSDAANLDRIIPHLRRAIDLSERLRVTQVESPTISSLVDHLEMAALIVDDKCRVLHMNHAANALMKQISCPLSVRANRLRVKNSSTVYNIEQAVTCSASVDMLTQTSAPPSTILVHRDGDHLPPLILKACSLRGGVGSGTVQPKCILLIHDPTRPLPEQKSVLRLSWGLTETEASLAFAVANGERIAEYAERMGISLGTARWHLKNIQTKTGTHRMEDVVRLVHSILLKV
jgi:DNA-binding CsgD family transcriptional regulator